MRDSRTFDALTPALSHRESEKDTAYQRQKSLMPDHSEPLATRVSQLCLQLAEGDVAALGQLFDLTAARLVRYAETISRRREDAEDALQVAMIKLAQHPERLAQAEQPWAYFVKMVRNETLKLAESRRSRSRVVELLRTFATVARRAVVLTDLERHPVAYYFLPLTKLIFGWDRITLHDGPISVEAGFHVNELESLARAAGLAEARVSSHRPAFRLALVAPIAIES